MKNLDDLKWLNEFRDLGARITKIADAYIFQTELSNADIRDINVKIYRFCDLLLNLERKSELDKFNN